MKQLTLIMALALFFSLSACSGNQNDHQSENKQTTAVASAPAETEEGKVIHLDAATFKEKVWDYTKNPDTWKYNGELPAIIDFYADWCRPCKMIAPIMEELAEEYKGKIVVYKIDTDKQKELAQVFNIRSIPAVLFVPMNEKPQMSTGALPKPTFEQAIREVLKVQK